MKRRRVRWALLCSLALPASAGAELTVVFDGTQVVVREATPQGGIAVVSIARVSTGWVNRVDTLATLVTDSDGDGIAILELDEPAVDRSIWAVVDVTSGEAIVVSPGMAGIPLEVEALELVKRGQGGVFNELGDDREVLDLAVVRPGEGAWFTRAWDGGTNDQDHQSNGRIRIKLQNMEAMDGSSARLNVFDVGDVLIGLNRQTFEFYAVQIASPPGQS